MVYYEKAIDVSSYQGSIDWQKVRHAGIKHAMIKATEGFTFQDQKFLYNWHQAQENGIQPKAYHYFRAVSSSATDQVKNIVNMLGQCNFVKSRDILVIDVEKKGNEQATASQMAHNLYSLVIELENQKIQNIYIYCNNAYWENHVNWQFYNFSKYPLWIAAWTKAENLVVSPTIPTTWKNRGWAFWQYSNGGRIAGIRGNVDLDLVKI